jgi:ATP-dependent exoDNAse (exonuclease V) alpha subunit
VARTGEIDAGGAFAALAQRLGAGELVYNRRQQATWERHALDNLRSGDVGLSLASYAAQGRVHERKTLAAARMSMVTDWLEARDTGKEVRMLASRRADVDALNRLARSALTERGEIGPNVSAGANRCFAVSDEVMCLRNNRHLDVRNGTRGTVVSGGEDFVVITTEDGTRRIDQSYLEAGGLDHGYATTIHKSQGQTLDRAFVLGTASVYREAAYVAMSRARNRTDLYVVDGALEIGIEPRGTDGPLAALTKALSASRAKALASDAAGDSHGVTTEGKGTRAIPRTDVLVAEREWLATESRRRSSEELSAPRQSRGRGR